MVEYVASTSVGIRLRMQKSCAIERTRSSSSHNPHFRVAPSCDCRHFWYGTQNLVCSPGRKIFGLGILKRKVSLSPRSRRAISKCNCLGSLVDPEGALASSWIPIVDQVLLTASVLLTYMGGVIPIKRSYQKGIFDEKRVPESSTPSGSSAVNDKQASPVYAFDVVKRKLLDSIDAFERGTNVGSRILEYNEGCPKQPLHLSALADGPRLRLLWATFQKLEEEVNNISNSESLDMYDRLAVFSSVIQKSCQSVCMNWLEMELGISNSTADTALLSMLRAKLSGDNTVLLNIKNSGKEDLYADLLCFLGFGSSRDGCCYDKSLFFANGVSILEDLLINLADGMASIYLELISVDSNVSSEMNNFSLELCALSTRALQRLRNEVALNQWLYQNLESVASMYEDRFDLCILQRQLIEEPSNFSMGDSWWKKFTWKKSTIASSSLCYVAISHFSMSVKRTKELRALAGWRYYFSLFLELSDIGMPLVRAVISKVSDAISFFLVCLIGRSLGLIYTGIRQSLGWK